MGGRRLHAHETPLGRAAKSGNDAEIRRQVEVSRLDGRARTTRNAGRSFAQEGVKVDRAYQDGQTALHVACANGRKECARC